MQLSAVILARAMLLVESFDLNPTGKAFYPDIVQGLVEKCGFMKFPTKIEDFDENKGVEFIGGRWDGVTIEAMKIFTGALQVDTRASTSESERILYETLGWAHSKFGIKFEPRMVKRTAYVSDLTFHSDVPILGDNYSPLAKLTASANTAIAELTGQNEEWLPNILTLNVDLFRHKQMHAAFTIQRRADTPLSQNKYYSEAPFATDVHIKLLEQFESDVSKASGRS
jgi:hypothetical protein